MNKKNLEKAANRAVTESRRNMLWPVYREYTAEYHDDLPVLVAPEPEPHFRPLRDDAGTRLLDDTAQIDFGIKRHYAPLLHPEIVLRLVEIGDQRRDGRLSLEERPEEMLETMQVWANEYGLLGVRDETGRQESIVDFDAAARNVARTLRLFESATANNGEGDRDKLRGFFQTNPNGKLATLRERALDEVEMNVSEALRYRTYHAQYRLRDKAGRTIGFDEGAGFHDLYGACWLLLSYLIRDPNARRCIVCSGFLDPTKYSDSKYCSARCKQQAWRDRERKKQRAG